MYDLLYKQSFLEQFVVATVVNFFLVEAETRRRWDIFQAEVPLYWELAVASLQSSKSDFCSAQ